MAQTESPTGGVSRDSRRLHHFNGAKRLSRLVSRWIEHLRVLSGRPTGVPPAPEPTPRAVESERRKLRAIGQMLIAEIGAAGPESAVRTAERAAMELRKRREAIRLFKLEEAETRRDLDAIHAIAIEHIDCDAQDIETTVGAVENAINTLVARAAAPSPSPSPDEPAEPRIALNAEACAFEALRWQNVARAIERGADIDLEFALHSAQFGASAWEKRGARLRAKARGAAPDPLVKPAADLAIIEANESIRRMDAATPAAVPPSPDMAAAVYGFAEQLARLDPPLTVGVGARTDLRKMASEYCEASRIHDPYWAARAAAPAEEEKPRAIIQSHPDGSPGRRWCWLDENYPDEGSVGPFGSREEAANDARLAGYLVTESAAAPTDTEGE